MFHGTRVDFSHGKIILLSLVPLDGDEHPTVLQPLGILTFFPIETTLCTSLANNTDIDSAYEGRRV